MDEKQAHAVIEALEHIRKRPGMYFSDEFSAAINFITGFETACRVLFSELERTTEVVQDVLAERGWQGNSTGFLWKEMETQGLEQSAIIEELLAIEIEIWKRRAGASVPDAP